MEVVLLKNIRALMVSIASIVLLLSVHLHAGENGAALLPDTASPKCDPSRFEPVRVFGLGLVQSADYSPDGRRIAVAGPGVVYILDADRYEIERQLLGHTGWVWSVRWSPNGKFVASGSQDRSARIWDALTGQLLQTINDHGDAVSSVAWSPDSRYLASGSTYGTVISDANMGTVERVLPGGGTAVAWSPNGQYVAAGGLGPVRIWEVETGDLVQDLAAHPNRVTSVAWRPDGRYLASSNSTFGAAVKVWDTTTWVPYRTWEAGIGAEEVAWSRNGAYLATTGGYTKIWNPDTDELVRSFGVGGRSVTWHPDGDRLANVTNRGLYILLTEGGEKGPIVRQAGEITSVSWSPDGTYIASAADARYEDRSVRIWEAATGRMTHMFRDRMYAVAWHPKGKLIAASSDQTYIWEVETGQLVRTFPAANPLVWSPDGNYLAGRVALDRILVWEFESSRVVGIFVGVTPTWSPDGRYLAASSYYVQGLIWIYEVESGQRVQEMSHRSIISLTWSPNGSYLASAGERPDMVRIWNPQTGEVVRAMEWDGGQVRPLAWSRDSRYLVGGTQRPAIVVWDAETGELVRELRGHAGIISSIQWSPVDNSLATGGSYDGTARLWGCLP